MAILIDKLVHYPNKPHGHEYWCHMVSDLPDIEACYAELHAFASRLGLKRCWFQRDHYDLTTTKHTQALSLGAVLIEGRVISRLVMARRMMKTFSITFEAAIARYDERYGI